MTAPTETAGKMSMAQDLEPRNSPYAQSSAMYLEHQLPVIPCMGKIPSAWDGKVWKPMFGWQSYADRMPTDGEIEQWDEWPGAGICLPLGGVSGLIAIDFDLEGAVLTALEHELAGLLTCRKRGRKGYTAFLRCWPGSKFLSKSEGWATKWNLTLREPGGALVLDPSGKPKSIRVVDLIGYGKQTVLPPSLHPETGQPYTWVSDIRLDSHDGVDDVPYAPDDLIERIERAIAPFQTDEDRRTQDRDRKIARGEVSDSWFRDLNNHAMVNLPAWIPDLIAPQYMHSQGRGNYRVVPYWRGVFDSPKVGITSEGIRDFAEDRSYTPIDLVMAVRSCSAPEAIEWLRGATKMPDAAEALLANGAFMRAALAQSPPAQLPPTLAVGAAPAPAPAPAPALEYAQPAEPLPTFTCAGTALPDGLLDPIGVERTVNTGPVPAMLPSCVLEPPGLLGEIARWVNSTAYRPIPQLSLMSAISFVANVMGPKYRGPTRLGTNLYMIGLAPTGTGKDHCLKAVPKLLAACRLGANVGGETIASGAGLLARLGRQANTIYCIDEFGSYLRAVMSPLGGSHIREIADYMLKLSGEIPDVFKGKDYADNSARGLEIKTPVLNVFGMSTSAAFYSTLSREQLENGFLNRIILVDTDDRLPSINGARSYADVPDRVPEWAETIMNVRHPTEPLRGLVDGTPHIIRYDSIESQEVLDDFRRHADLEYESLRKEGDGIESMTRRWHSNALKLATVAAGALHPEEPRITVEAAKWAVAYVKHYATRAIDAVRSNVADSAFEAMYQACMKDLRAAGKRGLTRRNMRANSRAWRKLDTRGIEQMIVAMREGGQMVEGVTGARGGTTYWWHEYAPEQLRQAIAQAAEDAA